LRPICIDPFPTEAEVDADVPASRPVAAQAGASYSGSHDSFVMIHGGLIS
jgi:3-oxoacid CoA-transferase subunit B